MIDEIDMSEGGRYITPQEAAIIWGCSRQNMYYHIKKGTFSDIKRFGPTRFSKQYVGINKSEVLALRDEMTPRGQVRTADRPEYKKAKCRVCGADIEISWDDYTAGNIFCVLHQEAIQCVGCPKWFVPRTPTQIYHDRACSKKAYGKRRAMKTL